MIPLVRTVDSTTYIAQVAVPATPPVNPDLTGVTDWRIAVAIVAGYLVKPIFDLITRKQAAEQALNDRLYNLFENAMRDQGTKLDKICETLHDIELLLSRRDDDHAGS